MDFQILKAINVVRGKYDDHDKDDNSEDGEVSHFQALATAVSGTVGNGNGVALAIAGPEQLFDDYLCLLGMSTKLLNVLLVYRDVGKDGTVYGGPMYYLTKVLKKKVLKL